MDNILVRKEQLKDINQVYNLHRSAFNQEDEAKLVNALRKNDHAFIPELSLVATIDEKIVGHILFTEIQIINDIKEEFSSLALAPVAVDPAFQRMGIGSMLIEHGLLASKQLGYKSVIVLGHEHYYPKFGFVPAEQWNIRAPFEIPKNAFMAIELEEEGLSGISGTVKYAREFEKA